MQNSSNIAEKRSRRAVSSSEELYEFDVIGMNCTGCAQSIRSYLEKSEGISAVDLNFTSEICSVTYDPARTSR